MAIINRWFDKILYIGTAFSSIIFFCIVLTGVFSRYVLQQPVLASIELSRLLFVWSCLFAAAIGYRKKSHIAITILFDKLSSILQNSISLLLYGLILFFCGVVFYQSIIIGILLWRTDLPMLGISQAWFYLPLPFFCIVVSAYTIEFIIDILKVQQTP